MKYRIVSIEYPWSNSIRYKIRLRKFFLGLIPYWVWVEEWDEKYNDYVMLMFDSVADAEKHMQFENEYNKKSK